MASPRAALSRLALVLALALPLAGAAGCGEDADPSGARVTPGADAPTESTAGEAAGDAAQEAEDGAGEAVEEAAPGGAQTGAGDAGGGDLGETPYEGDGDGDSSDEPGATGPGAPAAPSAGNAPAEPGGAAPAAPAEPGGAGAGGAEADAGDEEGAAVPASFTLEDGGAVPMRVEVPAFLSLVLEVENAEDHPVEVRLRAPGAEAFTVGAGETASRTLAGVAPGFYPVEVDGGASGAVVVAQG